MKIIICGLPGTGKTTLSNMISEKYNIKLLSDWDIFKDNNIKIDNMEDKNIISKQYAEILFQNINQYDDVVVDLEYSISPEDYKQYNNTNTLIVYLGFASVNEMELYKLFRKSESNNQYGEKDLKEKIKFYKQMSLDYKLQCEKVNLKFFDINKDRKIIFEEILKYLNL